MRGKLIFFLGIFLLFLNLVSVSYFRKREKRLLGRLQEMLDEAISGTFEDKQLDETPLSLMENSLWRYLCDNRLAYLELARQKQQMQELISDIAHQSITPIANIQLYSQLLEEDILPSGTEQTAEAAEEIHTISEQVEKLDFLIQSLVKLSRLETGIISVSPKEQCISSVLSALQQQFALKAAQKNIRLEVEPSMETAVFDRKWTIEAIANLVDNAIKYTPEGGTVAIRILPYTMFLRIDIMDTGMGIPEQEQGTIFARFYRSAAASDKQGVGIGLYLAREVMKEQNAYIKVSSKVGQGSTFSVFLLKNEMSQN